MKWLAVIVAAAVLAGCAAGPRPVDAPVPTWNERLAALAAVQTWLLTGRIAVRNDEEGWNGAIAWRQRPDSYDIQFSGPLGQGGARLEGTRGQVELQEADGTQYHGTDAEALLLERLGWRVPLTELRYWVTGRPAPGTAPERLEFDEDGRLALLRQAGWQVTYKGYQSLGEVELPRKVYVENHRLNVRLVVDQWQLGVDGVATR